MEAEGWRGPGAKPRRAGLATIGTVALGLTAFCLIVAAAGGRWWWPMIVGILALAVAGSISLILLARYPPLSRTGQEAAIPWKAYRAGLKETTADDSAQLDLDATLPDLIALGLGSSIEGRLEAAGRSGRTVRALAAGAEDATAASYVPLWAAFSATTASSSGGTASGAGASGGGGAAGST